MDKAKIEDIIIFFESMLDKIRLLVGTDVLTIKQYIAGFYNGCATFGMPHPHLQFEICEQITRDRGWEWTPAGLFDQAREAGLDDNAIAKEFLTIEIEVLKRMLKEAKESTE